jgi:hypothetical protein
MSADNEMTSTNIKRILHFSDNQSSRHTFIEIDKSYLFEIEIDFKASSIAYTTFKRSVKA